MLRITAVTSVNPSFKQKLTQKDNDDINTFIKNQKRYRAENPIKLKCEPELLDRAAGYGLASVCKTKEEVIALFAKKFSEGNLEALKGIVNYLSENPTKFIKR